jgi:hypothetical protein
MGKPLIKRWLIILMAFVFNSCADAEVRNVHVDFERTGGFAGIAVSATIDSADLSESQAGELRKLIDQADFYNLPAVIAPPKPHPDRFQYSVTVRDNGRQHTVRVSEEAMPPNVSPLIKWLSEAARQGRKRAIK